MWIKYTKAKIGLVVPALSLALIFGLFSNPLFSSSKIVLIKPLSKSLSEIEPVFVTVVTDDYTGDVDSIDLEKGGRWGPTMVSEIRLELKNLSTKFVFLPKEAKTRLVCKYKDRWAVPHFGRRISDVRLYSPGFISMSLVDIKSNEILAEVEYRRKIISQRPPEDLLENMLKLLLSDNQENKQKE